MILGWLVRGGNGIGDITFGGDDEQAEYWIDRLGELAPDGLHTNVAMHRFGAISGAFGGPDHGVLNRNFRPIPVKT